MTDMHPINKPEVFVRNGQEAFDAEGNLVDDETAKVLARVWPALVGWTLELRA